MMGGGRESGHKGHGAFYPAQQNGIEGVKLKRLQTVVLSRGMDTPPLCGQQGFTSGLQTTVLEMNNFAVIKKAHCDLCNHTRNETLKN